MKKLMTVMAMLLCLSLVACGKSAQQPAVESGKEPDQVVTSSTVQQPAVETNKETDKEASKEPEQTVTGNTVKPLPDTTMDNLTDGIFSVSLEKGDAYVDDTGKMQMELKIYSYDKYDMVDIANLQVGDGIVSHAGEVKVTDLKTAESGLIFVNGGQDAGGFDLFTDESGVYFEVGFNDAKNWYQVGEAKIRVSVDFEGHDFADPTKGDVVLFPGSFLGDEVTNYDFTPYNTTIRVEDGQVMELTRVLLP